MSRRRPIPSNCTLIVAATFAICAVSSARAITTTHQWVGSGTMGQTATDPASAATNFHQAANWSGGVPNGPDANATIGFSNPGAVYLKSPAVVRSLKVTGVTDEASLQIQADLTLNILGLASGLGEFGRVVQSGGTVKIEGGSLGLSSRESVAVYDLHDGELTTSGDTFVSIGDGGLGVFNHSGGRYRALREIEFGGLREAEGVYNLSGGVLDGASMRLGYIGKGTFHQTGGQATLARMTLGASTLGNTQAHSTLRLSGGALRLGKLTAGGLADTVELEFVDPAAELAVAEEFFLGANASLEAAPGFTIKLGAARFRQAGVDPLRQAGLANLVMRFEGGAAEAAEFEVASEDVGPRGSGFDGNFALGALEVGGTQPAYVRLVDLIVNRPTSGGNEALYVDRVSVTDGSILDLQGRSVYARTIDLDAGATIAGGAIQLIPEPSGHHLAAAALAFVAGGAGFRRRVSLWSAAIRQRRDAGVRYSQPPNIRRGPDEAEYLRAPHGVSVVNANACVNIACPRQRRPQTTAACRRSHQSAHTGRGNLASTCFTSANSS
jgi:hypothetical protein